MSALERRILIHRLGERGAIVRLPRVFWLYRAFRSEFRRALPGRQAWTFVVPGKGALRRLGEFDRAHGARAAAEIRRRERARQDAEWDAIELEARAA